MLEGKVRIVNPLGLHARAASRLVRLASGFKCRITTVRLDTGVFADAKSILSVLTLAAPQWTELTLKTDGVDEADAFEAVSTLIGNGFGEL